jgi:hypothetical protein
MKQGSSGCGAPMGLRLGFGLQFHLQRLYNTLVAAKKKAGENVSGNLDSFSTFVQKKTEQIRKQLLEESLPPAAAELHSQRQLKRNAKTGHKDD